MSLLRARVGWKVCPLLERRGGGVGGVGASRDEMFGSPFREGG